MKKIIFIFCLLLTLHGGVFASPKAQANPLLVAAVAPAIMRIAVASGSPIVVSLIKTAARGWVAKVISGQVGYAVSVAIVPGSTTMLAIAVVSAVSTVVTIYLAWEGINWTLKNKAHIAEVVTATWEDSKWVIKQTWDNVKWVATCHTNAVVGATTGGIVGGVSGAFLGGTIGTSLATASCLASIGLSVGTFGVTTLLSVGICGTAIAAGAATGTAIGAGVGGTVGAVGGGAVGVMIDDENSCTFVKT